MTNYIISATYDDNGTRCVADSDYALGDYADTVFDSRAAAEKILKELKRDIGIVVHSSIEYEIEEIDSTTTTN